MVSKDSEAVPNDVRMSRARELTHQLRKNVSDDYMRLQALLRLEAHSVNTLLSLQKMKLRALHSLRTITSLEMLLNDAIARIDRPTYCSVDAMLKTITDTLNTLLFLDKEVHINFHGGEKEIWAVLDIPRVERILFSIIENTLQYRPDCNRITLQLKVRGTNLQFWIKESSTALPQEEFDLLFRKYTAVTSGTLDPSVKQGLSLALAEQAALDMDGSLTAENQANGLKFVLSLPLRSARVNAESAAYSLKPETVLPLFADFLIKYLEQQIAQLQPSEESS